MLLSFSLRVARLQHDDERTFYPPDETAILATGGDARRDRRPNRRIEFLAYRQPKPTISNQPHYHLHNT